MTAVALIGGLDPSGGAGLLRDAWTAELRAPELEHLFVCTALTRQGRGRPATHARTVSPTLARELARVAAHPGLRAVKLGMIPAGQVAEVVDFLVSLAARPHEQRPRIVCDPVLDASDGGRLGPSPEALLSLIARVDLLTPNHAERGALESVGELPATVAVLFKGERIPGRPAEIRDRLRESDGRELSFDRPRVLGPDPRGTGCALATAIACELARGRSITTAVAAGIAWLDGARRRLRPGPDGRWHLLMDSRSRESRPDTRP